MKLVLNVGLNVGLMLTDTKAKNMKPGEKPLPDGTVTGLRLIPSGTKGKGKWQLRYTSTKSKRRRDMGLGSYPATSIALARELATEAWKMLAEGIDPIDHRAKKQILDNDDHHVPTFEEVSIKVYDSLSTGWKNKKHKDQWINTINTYVIPDIGHLPVDQLKASDFAKVLKPIWLEKAETAARVKQRCQTIMKWCFARELVSGNPVDSVDHLLPAQPSASKRVIHHPSMPWREIPNFKKETIDQENTITSVILEFIIHTAVRSSEARYMVWSEIDFKKSVWNIPATRMKTGIIHRVPLTNQVIKLLEKQTVANEMKLVFPSPRNHIALTDMAMTKFLRDKKAQSDIPDRTATVHGFRSSFRDWASENSYSRDLAEKALAHSVKDKTEAAYHRTDLLEQRRPMMEAWSRYICN